MLCQPGFNRRRRIHSFGWSALDNHHLCAQTMQGLGDVVAE
jgi:hypothetical protein